MPGREGEDTVVGIDSIIIMLIVGAIAGWLAGQIVRGFGFGVIWNIVIGIVGAILGGFIVGAIVGGDVVTGINFTTILVAILGAIVLLLLYRVFVGRRTGRR